MATATASRRELQPRAVTLRVPAKALCGGGNPGGGVLGSQSPLAPCRLQGLGLVSRGACLGVELRIIPTPAGESRHTAAAAVRPFVEAADMNTQTAQTKLRVQVRIGLLLRSTLYIKEYVVRCSFP